MGDPRPLNQTLRGLIAFQCVVLAPIVVWARPITQLLLGSRYSQSAEVLRALAPFVFFAGLAPLVVRAAGGPEVSPRVSIYAGTLAIAVAAGFILIPRRGVVGGAIAADIAIGFYVLAYIWVCRRRFDLRIRTLVWALASSLTAAAAMGIVLASVGTKDLTLADWLIGCFGGLAAYVAMLDLHARAHHCADRTRSIRGDCTTDWAETIPKTRCAARSGAVAESPCGVLRWWTISRLLDKVQIAKRITLTGVSTRG